jgi:hypothetical protein
LHPHAPRTVFGRTSDRNILGNRTRRAAMSHETRMIEAIASGHIVGVSLSERTELGAIGMAQANAPSAERYCQPKADDTERHGRDLAFARQFKT